METWLSENLGWIVTIVMVAIQWGRNETLLKFLKDNVTDHEQRLRKMEHK